jgi:hypothetical protein
MTPLLLILSILFVFSILPRHFVLAEKHRFGASIVQTTYNTRNNRSHPIYDYHTQGIDSDNTDTSVGNKFHTFSMASSGKTNPSLLSVNNQLITRTSRSVVSDNQLEQARDKEVDEFSAYFGVFSTQSLDEASKPLTRDDLAQFSQISNKFNAWDEDLRVEKELKKKVKKNFQKNLFKDQKGTKPKPYSQEL